MSVCILIIADSRGRGTKEHLQNSGHFPVETIYDESILPGANITKLFAKLRRLTRVYSSRFPTHRMIIFFGGGICDLTKRTHEHNQTQIYYQPRSGIVEQTKLKLKEVWDYTNERGYFLILSTIYPVSLLSFRDHYI